MSRSMKAAGNGWNRASAGAAMSGSSSPAMGGRRISEPLVVDGVAIHLDTKVTREHRSHELVKTETHFRQARTMMKSDGIGVFLNTYRTMCVAPGPQFRRGFEEIRGARLARGLR